MKGIKAVFFLMCAAVFGYFFFGSLFSAKDAPGGDYDFAIYEGTWEWLREDGSAVSVGMPVNLPVGRGETVRVRTLLDEETTAHPYMGFHSARQDMKIYVGDELRTSYSTESTRLIGKYSAPAYVFCALQASDAGKYLTLESVTDSAYSGVLYTVYIGDKMGFWYDRAKQQGLELVVAFLVLFLGFLSVVGSLIIGYRQHRKLELMYLGWGIVLAAGWLIANCQLRQIIFPALSVVNDMTFSMLLLLPIPFLIYMDSVQANRYHALYRAAELLAVADGLICGILHVFRRVDFSESFPFMATVCFIAIALIGCTIANDVRKGRAREYPLVAIGMLGVAVAAIAQILVYFRKSDEFHTTILAAGLIFLLAIAIVNTLQGILRIDREKQAAVLASEAESRFLANMSHEIRTPINAVLGMNAIILRETKEPSIREYAVDIENAGNTLLALTNDVLDLSKVRAGKMELVPTDYDLFGLVSNVVRMTEVRAEEKGLTVGLDLDGELPSKLHGDDVKLRQVLVNLMNNAVKYTEQGSVRLIVRGEQTQSGEKLRFAVRDTGIGIREEDMDRLFEKFVRIEEEKNRNIEGTGLGMAIAAQLLALMNSRLEVKSEYGRGSEFSFTLEQAVVDAAPIGDPSARVAERSESRTHERVFEAPGVKLLVVDDNPLNRKVFRGLLKDAGMELQSAENGTEALARLRAEKYDLIFLDDMMPDLNGTEVLARLRADADSPNKETPTVVFTANVVQGAREKYLRAGFADYLSKPIRTDRLEKIMKELLPAERWRYSEQEKGDGARADEGGERWEFPETEGVDWDYALERQKEREPLLELARDFALQADDEMEELASYYRQLFSEAAAEKNRTGREGALRAYRIKVHAMKSSAALIGAMQVSALARLLEAAAESGQIDRMERLMPIFSEEWGRLGAALRQALPSSADAAPADGRPRLDDRMLAQYMEMLGTAMRELDTDAADFVVEELAAYRFDGHRKELLSRLGAAVRELNQEKADALIGEILRKP